MSRGSRISVHDIYSLTQQSFVPSLQVRGLSMSTFALIHGGSRRGRHWQLMCRELERLGHVAIAPDVPMEVVGAKANDWTDVVIAALDEAPAQDEVILVGAFHGCSRASPDRDPLSRPAADLPVCVDAHSRGPWNSYVAEQPQATMMPAERVLSDDYGRAVFPWDLVREMFYSDCDPEAAGAAHEHVVPLATTVLDEPCPIAAWPETPSTVILCQEDKIIRADWARQISLERFGEPAIELPGGHSPMLSRPDELAALLHKIAAS